MDIGTSEQLAFIPEQVESILMAVIDGILRTEVYLEEKVGHGMGWDEMGWDGIGSVSYTHLTLPTICSV